MQGSLALTGFLLGYLAWWQSGNWLWLAGATVLVVNWPYTLVIIMPVNNRLKSLEAAHDGALARPLLETWAKLHAGRSAWPRRCCFWRRRCVQPAAIRLSQIITA